MSGKIDLFSYGDPGCFDKNNPYYFYKKQLAPEVLYEIASATPYELAVEDIAKKLNANSTDLIDLLSGMETLGMVSKKQNKYSISFTVLLKKDIPIIESGTRSIALTLSKRILHHSAELNSLASGIKCSDEFGCSRILYHAIGCDFLDGSAFGEFSNRGVFSTSKSQYDNRDYILFGFEDDEALKGFSEQILCSRNCTGASGIDFVSFGDANGDREDMYRFMKQVISLMNNATMNTDLNLSYIHIVEQKNRHLVQLCAEIVKKIHFDGVSFTSLSTEEEDAVKFLKELEFVEIADTGALDISVPVFDADDQRVFSEISTYLMDLIGDAVAAELSSIKSGMKGLTGLIHGVDEKEIANELWHQILGCINENLISAGFFSNPKFRAGEGRYFQAIYLENTDIAI